MYAFFSRIARFYQIIVRDITKKKNEGSNYFWYEPNIT